MNIHPNDKLAALQWAVSQAEKAKDDPLVGLSILPCLREMQDEAKREAGK